MPTISDDDAALIIKALEHYHAYLVAAKREDSTYQELAERLKRKPSRRYRNQASGTGSTALAIEKHGRTPHLLGRGPKLAYRIVTRQDRMPADAVVRMAVDVRRLRARIDRALGKLHYRLRSPTTACCDILCVYVSLASR